MVCLICQRISKIEKGTNSFFVKELQTGYVVLGDTQYQMGYTLFLSKIHKKELHELSISQKLLFLKEMSIVSEAVYKSFHPDKLNYELLGNTDQHMHWHFFPRYSTDLYPSKPIWNVPTKIRNAKKYIPNAKQIDVLRQKLLKYL